MHRHDAARRKDEVQQAEHRLLHLAGVGSAADQDQLLREVDRDDRLAAGAVALGIGAEARQVDDRIVGIETGQIVRFGTHQQRADEEIVPGELVDHTHTHPVLGLRSADRDRRRRAGPCRQVRAGNRRAGDRMRPDPSACCRCSTRPAFSVSESLTVNLSCALRPVCLPVRTTSGPSLASSPSPRRTACSTSGAVVEIPENFGASGNTLRFKAAVREPVSHVEEIPY